MGVRMGMFRVAKAVKILGHVFGWIVVAITIWVTAFVSTAEGLTRLGGFATGVIAGAVIILAAHGVAWIIEGFAPEN